MCPYCSTPASLSISIPEQTPPARKVSNHTRTPLQEESDSPRILVVDDDPVIREMVAGALSLMKVNPEVRQAANGVEGLAEAKEWKPDVVITDLQMPGMNGFELCEHLRSDVATAFIPILMLTVTEDELHRTKGYMVGTDDYMGKPFSVPELNARISRLLRKSYGY